MRTCKVHGCGRRHDSRGWCVTHYQQWRRGDEPGLKAMPRDELVRLRRAVGVPDDGPGGDERKRWHEQEVQGGRKS